MPADSKLNYVGGSLKIVHNSLSGVLFFKSFFTGYKSFRLIRNNKTHMSKFISILILSVFCSYYAYPQKSTSKVPITVTQSQNNIYSIKSISYDTEYPNLRGKSIIYENGRELYRINRSFDLYDTENYTLAISNDGKTVIYLINDIFWRGEEFEYVTVYRDGNLAKTYNLLEFTGCDSKKEKCSLIYDNYIDVVDMKKSKYGTKDYKKIFKENTSEEEIFLNDNYIVVDNDVLYLTDSRKTVTSFDLSRMEVIEQVNFDEIYPKIRLFKKPDTNISYYTPSYKYIPDFEDTQTNKTISETIGAISGLKFISISDSTYSKYKLYRVELNGYLNQNGEFEIEKLETDQKLDKEKISEYISNATFKNDFLTEEVEKQYFKNFYGGFRDANDSIAEAETNLAKNIHKREFENRKTFDSINGIYIPQNLKESINHLDKKLDFEAKTMIKEEKDIWKFNSHISPLGIWIRNNWGINGGSRLLKYFNDRGITDRDEISAIIIKYYQKWLIESKDVWSEWESKNPKKK